jgi:cytochrome c-type biogenesis protein CcmH/NrfG
MRITRIVLAIAFAAFAVASWAKYEGVGQPKVTFAERWAPVDAAVQSGEFRQQ